MESTSQIKKYLGPLYAVIGVILLLIIAAFWPVSGDVLWHRIYTMQQLKGIYITQGLTEPVVPNTFGFKGLKAYSPVGAPGTLGDFAESGGTRVAVVRTKEGASQQVELLGRNSHSLSTESGAKASVALSPDGNLVAYSVATSTEFFSADSSVWTLHLVDMSKDTNLELGNGFDASFFKKDGDTWLLYTTSKGIAVLNTKTLKSFTTALTVSRTVGVGPRISPDGQYLAFRDSARLVFSLYRLTSISTDQPLRIQPLPQDISAFSDVWLTSKGVLGVDLVPDSFGRVGVRMAPYGSAKRAPLLYALPGATRFRFISSSSL